MEYPLCRQSIGEKEVLLQLVQAISQFFIRNFKNFVNCEFLGILKIGLFHRVKELSKSIKVSKDCHQFNQSVKQKEFLLQLVQAISQFFIRNFKNFANCELLRILRIGPFHRVKELSKTIKVSKDYHQCNQSVKQKEFLVQLAWPKSWVFIRKFANFAMSEC